MAGIPDGQVELGEDVPDALEHSHTSASTAAVQLPWVFAAADHPPSPLTAGLTAWPGWLAMAGFLCVLRLGHTRGKRSAAGAVAGTAGDFGATGSTRR